MNNKEFLKEVSMILTERATKQGCITEQDVKEVLGLVEPYSFEEGDRLVLDVYNGYVYRKSSREKIMAAESYINAKMLQSEKKYCSFEELMKELGWDYIPEKDVGFNLDNPVVFKFDSGLTENGISVLMVDFMIPPIANYKEV